jgi:transcriptional regulator with XRE-family HTH domain
MVVPMIANQEAIKVIRERSRLSKRELANATESSTGYIHDIESGRRAPSPEMIGRIADALAVPLTAIILQDEELKGHTCPSTPQDEELSSHTCATVPQDEELKGHTCPTLTVANMDAAELETLMDAAGRQLAQLNSRS